MKEMWDKRFSVKEYVYGKQPNRFFKDALQQYDVKGRILLPAEGEGRNAVYAAKTGLSVSAFDISTAGKEKAERLAAEEHVKLEYKVGRLADLGYKENMFDCAALIYAHFPPEMRAEMNKNIARLIKPGGMIFIEGFSEGNLELRAKNPSIGGPDKKELLFTTEKIKSDFINFEAIQLEEKEVLLDEGPLHQGVGRVIRFIGKKQ